MEKALFQENETRRSDESHRMSNVCQWVKDDSTINEHRLNDTNLPLHVVIFDLAWSYHP